MASPRLYESVKTLSVGEPVLTLSDHCPVRAVIKVKIVSILTYPEHYIFIENPSKLSWNKDMSYKFENILQTEEYKNKFEKYLSDKIDPSQGSIDKAALELTELLVNGVIQADGTVTPNKGRKTNMKAGSRRAHTKISHPKWHDLSCAQAHSIVVTTAKCLKGDPKNSFLRSKLRKETKTYNKLVKSKQKLFVVNIFTELDSMQHKNPRGYMQLIKSMRDGDFDKQTPDDTSGVGPTQWHIHFSNLLAKNIDIEQKK